PMSTARRCGSATRSPAPLSSWPAATTGPERRAEPDRAPSAQPADGVFRAGLCRRGAGPDRWADRPAAQLFPEGDLWLDPGPGNRLSDRAELSVDHQAG